MRVGSCKRAMQNEVRFRPNEEGFDEERRSLKVIQHMSLEESFLRLFSSAPGAQERSQRIGERLIFKKKKDKRRLRENRDQPG